MTLNARVIVATTLTLFMVAIHLLSFIHLPLPLAYRAFIQWDGYRYVDIARNGYSVPTKDSVADYTRSNVAFFPGYPFAIKAFATIFQMDFGLAALLVAQLSCALMWFYFISILGTFCTTPLIICLSALLFSYPSSFYLVVSYSESFYLAAALGFMWWVIQKGRNAVVLASVHGFVMASTRIFGVPLAFVPLILNFRRNFWIALTALSGSIAFFLYCYLHFDAWDAYFLTEKAVWGVEPRFLALFDPEAFAFCFALPSEDAKCFGQLFTPITLILMSATCVVAILSWVRIEPFRDLQMISAAAALGSFVVTIAGRASLDYLGVLRYHLPTTVFCLFALAPAFSRLSVSERIRKSLMLGLAFLCLVLIACQIVLSRKYMTGGWVA